MEAGGKRIDHVVNWKAFNFPTNFFPVGLVCSESNHTIMEWASTRPFIILPLFFTLKLAAESTFK